MSDIAFDLVVDQRDRAWKALRFIYRNGLMTDPDRPRWVTEIISDAFGPDRKMRSASEASRQEAGK